MSVARRTAGGLLLKTRAVFKKHLSPDHPSVSIFIQIFTSFLPLTFGPSRFFLRLQSQKGREGAMSLASCTITYTWEIQIDVKIVIWVTDLWEKKSKILKTTSIIHPFSFFLFRHHFFPGKSDRASCCFPVMQHFKRQTFTHWFISVIKGKGEMWDKVKLWDRVNHIRSNHVNNNQTRSPQSQMDFRRSGQGEHLGGQLPVTTT